MLENLDKDFLSSLKQLFELQNLLIQNNVFELPKSLKILEISIIKFDQTLTLKTYRVVLNRSLRLSQKTLKLLHLFNRNILLKN